jgi:Protein of unknown function (DUF3016)
MRSCWLAILGLLAGSAVTAAKAETIVTFVHPERFTDASPDGIRPADDRTPALQAMRREFERLGQRLPPGQVLRIEVLDVDLAGIFEPWRLQAPTTRFVNSATWPRVRLRYVLERPGQPPLQGEEDVKDMSYLRHSTSVLSVGPLRYEEAMLYDWFNQRFGMVQRVAGRGN